jgi:predicted deacetylase
MTEDFNPRSRPSKASYLLRFDDLCPTMDRNRWRRFKPLLKQYGLRPILAIVPDNQDPELEKEAPDPAFWDQMLEWQASGATIALHGYQHLCHAHGRSLVNLHHDSEFAGVPQQKQREWIQSGLSILRGHGLEPTTWVAPRHGFDQSTLAVLREVGINLVSDGLADGPRRRDGLLWIPQQLWAPRCRKAGLWTIAYHPNTTSNADVEKLEIFLAKFHDSFTSVQQVVADTRIMAYRLRDHLRQELATKNMKFSKACRKLFR